MNDNIRLAQKQDIPSLCEIWKQCFEDSKEYIELFYHNNFERIKAFIFVSENKPVSMLHIIDATLKDKGNSQPTWFIYATGTLPNYRKKGCMSALIKHVKEMADKNGYALCLKPSTASTKRFYKSFGFEEQSALNLISINPTEMQQFSAYELSFNEYNRMRENAFDGIPHIEWSNAHIKWCVLENEYFSGKTLGIKYENKDYFLMGYPENNTLIINETDLTVNQIKNISNSLGSIFGTERIEAYMPAFCGEGEKAISIMLYNSQINNPYINMIMI